MVCCLIYKSYGGLPHLKRLRAMNPNKYKMLYAEGEVMVRDERRLDGSSNTKAADNSNTLNPIIQVTLYK